MPSSPRRDVVDPDTVGIYHCYNRCSQRAFLCGFDPFTQQDFSYRKRVGARSTQAVGRNHGGRCARLCRP